MSDEKHKHVLDYEETHCVGCGMSIHDIELEERIEELKEKLNEHLEDDSDEIRNELARQIDLISELFESKEKLESILKERDSWIDSESDKAFKLFIEEMLMLIKKAIKTLGGEKEVGITDSDNLEAKMPSVQGIVPTDSKPAKPLHMPTEEEGKLFRENFIEKPEESINYSRQKNVDLGIIISDTNGSLKEYKPSQFVIDTAKHYEYLRLVGYIFPESEKPSEPMFRISTGWQCHYCGNIIFTDEIHKRIAYHDKCNQIESYTKDELIDKFLSWWNQLEYLEEYNSYSCDADFYIDIRRQLRPK